YFAVNTELVNLDSNQGNMKHTYYLYEQNGKFSIIRWDYNMSFGGFGAGGGGMGMGTENRQKPVDASNSKSSPMENNRQTDQAGVDRPQ
ncbi:CotH kinase family protein, partial [Lysinibacillus sp. D4B1_S16]|uniref:CotH kinase family protein n=1 Tax=Lysinibacillus sp. D4B1_S16 TaxID=2941231 RepID=UPI0020C0D4C3